MEAAEDDLTARMVSMNNVRRALPLTGALGFALALAYAHLTVALVFAREEAQIRPCRTDDRRP